MNSKLPDGTVISQFFTPTSEPENGSDVAAQGLKMLIGQVEKVHYVDDPSNVSKSFVEYDVSVRDAAGGQSKLRNLRKEDLFGGTNDHDEVVLEANEHAVSGKLDPSNFFKNKNGTVVLVACMDGSKDRPVIVGVLQHPRRVGAKRSDGVRRKGEFRGVQWEINKEGELTLTCLGNRGPDGSLKRSNTGPTQIKIDQTGALIVTDNKGQRIEMNRVSNKILLTNGTSVILDGPGDVVKLETKGGTTAVLDGASGEVSIKDNGTGALKIKNSKVAIGASSAELLQQVVDVLDKLVLFLQNTDALHTHIGNLGYPTLLPVETAAFVQLATDLTTIKGKIDGIKGTL